MKTLTIVSLLCTTMAVNGQIMLNQQVSDPDQAIYSRTNNFNLFSIPPLNERYGWSHCYDSSEASTDQWSAPTAGLCFSCDTVSWEFSVKHAYNPSASNAWAFFLAADSNAHHMKTGTKISGYLLGVNWSGSDDTLRLWKYTKTRSTVIVKTPLNWEKNVGIQTMSRLRVERSTDGTWKVWIKNPHTDGDWYFLSEGTDNTLTEANWCGVFYKYTATADQKFTIEDVTIDGPIYFDTQAPELISLTQKATQLTCRFNESIKAYSTLTPSQFLLNGITQPDSVWAATDSSLTMQFSSGLINKTHNTLTLSGISDKSGNVLNNFETSLFVAFADWNDVVFSEIMADPEPKAGLPNCEYIELYNRSSYPWNIGGWTLQYGNTRKILPDTLLLPGNYALICTAACTDSFAIGSTSLIPVFSSSRSLSNTGFDAWLTNELNDYVAMFGYNPNLYKDPAKCEGGWSMEVIDVNNCSGDTANWQASVNPSGGTPGLPNSTARTNADVCQPFILGVQVIDDQQLKITFSEPVKPPLSVSVFDIQPATTPIAVMADTFSMFTQWVVQLVEPIETNQIYQLKVSAELTDFSGNSANPERECLFGLGSEPSPGQIVINEVLFNPPSGQNDFVELYNASDALFDFTSLYLNNEKEGLPGTPQVISKTAGLLLPNTYAVICTDTALLSQYYQLDEKIIKVQIEKMPSYPDDAGCVRLENKQGTALEVFCYTDKMHHAMLSVTEGVSLERIDITRLVTEPGNWQSAAQSEGFATPGRANSQGNIGLSEQNELWIENELFNPTAIDSHTLRIGYRTATPGMLGRLQVFDVAGRLVAVPAQNQVLGTSGFFEWDGNTQGAQPATTGVYLIYAEFYSPGKKVIHFKKSCVLVRQP